MDAASDLVTIALIAALAQTVNQAMGMGYGVITSSLLLSTGMPPAVISATVHVAEVGTSTTGALAHWRLGNVDRHMAFALAVPGFAGGFGGAVLLTWLPTDTARPLVGAILLGLGLLVLVRFAHPREAFETTRWSRRSLVPLAASGGMLDATGGGGWGPVITGTLMSRPPAAPRVVIGTANTGSVFVTIGVTLGFVASSGLAGFHFPEALALMGGGVVMSVPAAILARRVPTHILGVAVGVLLVTLNVRTIAAAFDASGATTVALMALAASAAALLVVAMKHRGVHPLEEPRATARVPVLAASDEPTHD